MMITPLTLAIVTSLVAVPPATATRSLEGPVAASRGAPLRIVTTLPVYADLVRAIGGVEVEVTSMASPDEDAHFVRPKPSYALALRRADLFVTTGLDLELWVPALLDKAGNADVAEGGRGYVTAYTGIRLLEIPAVADRSAGDVHIYGNPHLTTDPLRAIQVAENVTAGLKAVAPDRAALFDEGLARLTDRIHRRLFGDPLVDALGGETLARLSRAGTLFDFLENNELEGRPLTSLLGGWLATAEAFRGREMICYHKHWAYFEERFGVRCRAFVEAKPGIPPTPRHVAQLIDLMREQQFNVLFAASHFSADKVESVARRGGATAVIVPLYPGSSEPDYFSLVDRWVGSLAAAFERAGS